MAHKLTTNAQGEVEFFAGENTPAWHKLGTVIAGLATWEEAVEHAKLGWEVESRPIYIIGNDGNPLEINGKTAIVRGDNQYVLSVMTDRYKVLQNRECFAMWNAITAPEAGGDAMAVWDTAGSLDEGRKVFAQCKLTGGNIIIGKGKHKEETERRVLFFTSHDGSAAVTGLQTPIRVVCQNTLSAALANHSCKFAFRHTKNALTKVSEAQRVLGLATEYFKEYGDAMNHLYSQKVDSEYVKGFLETLFPAKADEEGDIHLRIGNKREAVELLFREGKGNRGENRYDLLNGLTEWVDHHQNGRVTQTSLNRTFRTEETVQAEQRFTRSLLGVGATLKQSALDYLLAN
jgi:phage/plasmid-like protein (TIGR03299 family)